MFLTTLKVRAELNGAAFAGRKSSRITTLARLDISKSESKTKVLLQFSYIFFWFASFAHQAIPSKLT